MAEVLETAKIKALGTAGSLNKGWGMWYATELSNAGYGDTKQAVKEFAKKVKKYVKAMNNLLDEEGHYILEDTLEKIDELVKEYEK